MPSSASRLVSSSWLWIFFVATSARIRSVRILIDFCISCINIRFGCKYRNNYANSPNIYSKIFRPAFPNPSRHARHRPGTFFIGRAFPRANSEPSLLRALAKRNREFSTRPAHGPPSRHAGLRLGIFAKQPQGYVWHKWL